MLLKETGNYSGNNAGFDDYHCWVSETELPTSFGVDGGGYRVAAHRANGDAGVDGLSRFHNLG